MTSALLALSLLAPQTYTNPVYDRDLPDPGLLRDGGRFWMTHTTGGPDVGWPLYVSKDARNWKFVTHLLDKENKPQWAKDTFWAPEIFRAAKDRYLLTFTAWNPNTGKLCIGMAHAKKIDGPYTVGQQPLIADSLTVLDSHIFRDRDGRLLLYWKRDGSKGGVNGDIRVRPLDRTGTRFAPGSKERVVLKGSDQARAREAVWEKGLVEAPWVERRGDYYYLFYSGAFTDTSYSLGVARSKSPFGPFARSKASPILTSNKTWGGPGHGAFFRDDAGTFFHYYHARRQSNPKAGRVQLIDRVIWKGGWPTFPNGGTPTTTPQPVPRISR